MAGKDFDICVVGSGLIGSAIAKHLSQSNKRILLIGPKEPQLQDYDKNDIFGGFFDESRITRKLDIDPVWAELAQKSIRNYRIIEEESGVKFFHEHGYIAMGNPNNRFVSENLKIVKRDKLPIEMLQSGADIHSKFPFIRPPANCFGIYEPNNAGSINPRKLVLAQLKIAEKNGCQIFPDTVVQIHRSRDENWELTTANGGKFKSKQVVLAPGSFMFHHQILPTSGRIPDMRVMAATYIRIPVDEGTLCKFWDEKDPMPSMMMEAEAVPESRDGGYHTQPRFYWAIPPFRYPDGRFYFKFGDSADFWLKELRTPTAVTDWWRTGAASVQQIGARLSQVASRFFPDLNTSEFEIDVCTTESTVTERPFLDEWQSGLWLATGGNGMGAKSSEEIARLAARLLLRRSWDSTIPRSVFRIHTRPSPKL